MQTEIYNNTMIIASILGGGVHSHIFLTINAVDLLTQTVTLYIAQVAPPVSPVHQDNAIGPQIDETIRQ